MLSIVENLESRGGGASHPADMYPVMRPPRSTTVADVRGGGKHKAYELLSLFVVNLRGVAWPWKGGFEVIALLPAGIDEPAYRIRNADQAYDRIVREHELSKDTDGMGRQRSLAAPA